MGAETENLLEEFMMKIVLKIRRFNPEATGAGAYFQRYNTDVEPTDRLLDALMHVKQYQDGTLTFRKSCAHGVCGSDAMRVNGKARLACKTLIGEVAGRDGDIISIEPLNHFPVERDLVIDQELFLKKYRSVKPYLINDEPVKEKERLQTPEERKKYDDSTNCILCAACFSACPILETNPDFLGPAAITQASRFNDDSRDRGFQERLPILGDPNGIWPCENRFECTRACPRGIKITKLINQTKRRVEKSRDG